MNCRSFVQKRRQSAQSFGQHSDGKSKPFATCWSRGDSNSRTPPHNAIVVPWHWNGLNYSWRVRESNPNRQTSQRFGILRFSRINKGSKRAFHGCLGSAQIDRDYLKNYDSNRLLNTGVQRALQLYQCRGSSALPDALTIGTDVTLAEG